MTTYKLSELAEATNLSPRTIRYYVQIDLLPPPEFRGPRSSYGPMHLLTLQVVKYLQGWGLELFDIRSTIAGADAEKLTQLMRWKPDKSNIGDGSFKPRWKGPMEGDENNRGVGPWTMKRTPSPPGASNPHAGNSTHRTVESEPQAWERVEIVPGVELHLKVGASVLAQRIAHEIRTLYGPHSPKKAEE